jgi:hypothetical protein
LFLSSLVKYTFIQSFTPEVIRRLIDICTTMPEEDTMQEGHKFPFNACELLCSENNFIADKLAGVIKVDSEDSDSDSESEKVSISRSISLERADESNNEEHNQNQEDKAKENDLILLDENEHDIAKDCIINDDLKDIQIKDEEYSNTIKMQKTEV